MARETVSTNQPLDSGSTHTTVIHETRSSSLGIVVALILLVAAVVAIYYVSRNSASETARDSAVAEAAGDVGDAAAKVGNAAEEAVRKPE